MRNRKLWMWLAALIFVIIVIGIASKTAFAQASGEPVEGSDPCFEGDCTPVLVDGHLTHPWGVVPGQKASIRYYITHANYPIIRCEGSWKPYEADEWSESVVLENSWEGTYEFTQIDGSMNVNVVCYWMEQGNERGYYLGFSSLPKDVAALKTPPQCYPKPVGSGTVPTLDLESGTICGAWHCTNENGSHQPRGICGNLSEMWSIDKVLAMTKDEVDTAWAEHDWKSLSEYERQRLLKLAHANYVANELVEPTPEPPVDPPVDPEPDPGVTCDPSAATGEPDACTYVLNTAFYASKGEDTPLFKRLANGKRSYSVQTKVDSDVRHECNCDVIADFAWGNWCAVGTDPVIPIEADGSGGAFGNCEIESP